jgi:uncharacterized circularly permuted ATP-grasp superfamily protein
MFQRLGAMAPAQFEERRQLADLAFLMQGITFTVYSDGRGTERLFPFDLIPRILPRSEWDRIERGLSQRVVALNLFLQDVYGQQRILKDRHISRALVYSCQHFRREMIGVEVPPCLSWENSWKPPSAAAPAPWQDSRRPLLT